MNQVKLADQTQYPNIFEWTFWSKYCSNRLDQQDTVINNRNSFVSIYHVLKLIDVFPRKVERFANVQSLKYKSIKHMEVYKSQDHPYIIIASPIHEPTETESQALIADGWQRIPGLFFSHSDSWIHLNPYMKRNSIPLHLQDIVD